MSRREVVDSQIHIWGANTPERPWPTHAWDGKPAHPQREEPLGAEETLARMDEAGVARAVLVPPSWEGDRNDLALALRTRAARQKWFSDPHCTTKVADNNYLMVNVASRSSRSFKKEA